MELSVKNRASDTGANSSVLNVAGVSHSDMMVDIKPTDLITKRTDPRGRITLGSEYANQEVTVIVAEVEE